MPHTSERFFGTDDTDEEYILFLLNEGKIPRMGSLGAVDMPTPFRTYRGTEMKKMNIPYFLEGWHTTQEQARRLAQIVRNAQSGRPSDKAVAREVLSLYRRTDEIVDGMLDVKEYMRMNMLQNGMFLLQDADDFGNKLVDLYNYDTNGSWNQKHIEVLSNTDAWSDTTNSDPIADILRYDKILRSQGSRLTAIMATSETLSYLFKNQNVKNYAIGVGLLSYILKDSEVKQIIEERLGHPIDIIKNDELYKDWDNSLKTYMQPNRVVFIGGNDIGTTWNGPTFEEDFNLINGGNGYKNQVRLNNGIVISEYFKKDPDEKVFRVSGSFIPSFEGMNRVYNLVWIDSNTQWTITYNANGGTGTTPNPQGVTKGEKMNYVAVGLLTNNNKRFVKWNTNANGTGTDVDRKFVPTADTTVYAIYEA